MSDTTIGFLILGLGLLLVLALVFAVTLRGGAARERPHPPRGVHLPSPSMLPVIMSLGAALIGAGLSFKPETAWDFPVLGSISTVVHPVLGPLGLVVLVYGIWAWVRAAGQEWRDAEREPHDATGH